MPHIFPLPVLQRARRVAVAMSGGVDSGMAAALLAEQGYEVIGLTMRLWREEGLHQEADIASAQNICRRLGIPHHVVDLREPFYEHIVEYFIQEYLGGRTPNPCIRCNRRIKFGLLLEQAQALGAEALATGHYARIAYDGERYHLLRGRDAKKDQSYFLYTLDQERLARLCFPLGEYTKEQVRAWAAERGFSHLAERSESQETCFIQNGDYRRFLLERAGEVIRPGPIYDREGRLLGQHQGLPFYTVGQRSGLGLSAPRPLYVIALDAARNALIVGYAEALGRRALIAHEVTTISGEPLSEGESVEAKIRYQARPVEAWVYPQGVDRACVRFAEPLRDITPGQAVVFYRGEEVLGGGTILQAADACDG